MHVNSMPNLFNITTFQHQQHHKMMHPESISDSLHATAQVDAPDTKDNAPDTKDRVSRQHAAHSGARVAQGDDTLRHSAATKQCAARSGVRTAEKRHSSHCSDATLRQHAARSGARAAERWHSSVFGCDEGNAQPTAEHALATRRPAAGRALQRNGILRHSTATNAVRKSWAFHCDEGGAQPTAAHALQGNEILALQCVAHSGVRTAEQRNSLIHGYPMMLYSFVVSIILVKYVLSPTVTVLCILYCYLNK